MGVSLLVCFSCASQKMPSGGPKDSTSPTISSTYPDSASVNFSDNRLRLSFDKWMNRSSINSAVFFSPAIRDYDIEWGGKDAEFILYEPLKPERTYSLTLTNALKDIRGNALGESYTLAFSTGSVLDSGSITGRVFDELNRPASGILVCAFLLPDSASIAPDTLNPSLTEPDYIAQTNRNGAFKLSYLAEGRYRVVGIKDENSNLKLDFGREQFAVPTQWPLRTGMRNLNMRLTMRDTLSIELQTVTPLTRHLISARFDRKIQLDSLTTNRFRLYDSTGLKSIKVYDFYEETQNKTPYLFLITDSLSEDHFYTLQVEAVWDKMGNRGTDLKGEFFGIAEPDTATALFKTPFPDSTSRVLLNQIPDKTGWPLELTFSRAINRESLRQALGLFIQTPDTLASTPVSLSFKDARKLLLQPEQGFRLGVWYKLVVDHSKIKDALNRPTLDSTFNIHFQIADSDLFGGIEGILNIPLSEKAIVSAWPLRQSKAYRTISSNNGKTATFEFRNIPEGNYVLSAFIPATPDSLNRFQSWFGGNSFPSVPAETFTIGNDTLRVRKRWTTSDVMLNFK